MPAGATSLNVVFNNLPGVGTIMTSAVTIVYADMTTTTANSVSCTPLSPFPALPCVCADCCRPYSILPV